MRAVELPDHVRAFFRYEERERWEALRDLFEDDATVVTMAGIVGSTTYSIDEYLASRAERAESYAEVEYTIEEVLATEPWVVVQVWKRAVRSEPYIGPNSPEQSKEESARELCLFRADDGIAELRRMTNVAKLLSDAGIVRGGDDLTIQRQHYRVLTRILRHNIKNDLSKIRGVAELVTEMPERVDEFSETILSVSDDLIGTVEKARSIEGPIVRGDHGVTDIDVAETVRETATAVAEETSRDPDLRVEIRDHPTLRSDPALVEPIVRELVENSIVHADSTAPRVDVVVGTTDDGRTRVTVADDGPGIVADELAPFEATSETELTHGSGIGLWIVSWGVERLDGEVSVDADDGTEVTVRLPPTPHTGDQSEDDGY